MAKKRENKVIAKRTFIVSDILWNVDVKRFNLPKKMKVTVTSEDVSDLNDMEDIEEFISDKITDITAFCHFGWLNTKEI